MNSRILTNSPFITPVYNFSDFSENGHSDIGFFHKKLVKSRGEFVKIQELVVVIISVIFPQKQHLGLKVKILKFLVIQPNYSPSPIFGEPLFV